MAFRDAKDFVDRFGPGSGKRLSLDNGGEDGAERFAQTQNAEKNGVNRMRFCVEKGAKAGGAILRNQASINKKGDKFAPGKIADGGTEISEIEGETAGNEVRKRSGHLTGVHLQDGYTRSGRGCKRALETSENSPTHYQATQSSGVPSGKDNLNDCKVRWSLFLRGLHG